MKIVKIFKKGIEQLQRKKRIRNLKNDLLLKREDVLSLYLRIGSRISDMDIEQFVDFEEVNSMKNVLNIIEKLEKENLELEEKIDITKSDYNQQIESYTPLIAELKENLSIPQNKLIALKEDLLGIKKILKDYKDILKEKEGIFKDTQDRLDNKSEEDGLDEEKVLILENDYKRLQKELLEITHNFETKTDEYNDLKESIKIVTEEIKTAEEQINTYKKEIGRLKKEKIRETDAIKKVISSNKNSILSRNKELEGIYKNIGNLSFSKNILPDEFGELYEQINIINSEVEEINKSRQALAIEIDKTEGMVLFKFFAMILVLIAVLVVITWGVYSFSDNANSSNKKDIVISENVEINNISCNKGEIVMKIPKTQKAPFSVKSNNLLSRLNKEGDNLKVIFSADLEDENTKYILHIFSSGKEFTKYSIESKTDDKNCLKFYITKP